MLSSAPPVKGFWTLTMYNQHHFFEPNAMNRYSSGPETRIEVRERRLPDDFRAAGSLLHSGISFLGSTGAAASYFALRRDRLDRRRLTVGVTFQELGAGTRTIPLLLGYQPPELQFAAQGLSTTPGVVLRCFPDLHRLKKMI